MKDQIFTWNELKEFVMAQRDERKIDMSDSDGNDRGCILIQFGRKKLNEKLHIVPFPV